MQVVLYTNESGLREFRKVPNGLHPESYGTGILVGPPDLSELGLSEESTLTLNNALVDAGYQDYRSLAGKRLDLLRLVQSTLALSDEEALELRLKILSIYQQDFFGV